MALRLESPIESDVGREAFLLVRYDWRTRAMSAVPYRDLTPEEGAKAGQILEDLGPDETVHRIQVSLVRPAPPMTRSLELYVENDHVDWDVVNARDAVYRINPARLFPVHPIKSGTGVLQPMSIRYDLVSPTKAAQTVSFMGRTFKVTIEEITTPVSEPLPHD